MSIMTFEPPIHWNDYEDIAMKLYERFGDDFNERSATAVSSGFQCAAFRSGDERKILFADRKQRREVRLRRNEKFYGDFERAGGF